MSLHCKHDWNNFINKSKPNVGMIYLTKDWNSFKRNRLLKVINFWAIHEFADTGKHAIILCMSNMCTGMKIPYEDILQIFKTLKLNCAINTAAICYILITLIQSNSGVKPLTFIVWNTIRHIFTDFDSLAMVHFRFR